MVAVLHLCYLLLYYLHTFNCFRKFSKWDVIQGETFHRVISFSQMSLNEGSSHQGKILSTRVSLSDGCLQSKFDYSCGAACRANVNSAKDFSTAFHRHSGDAM